MIKFRIVTRHQPGSTRERFYYEWAFVHVSLMLHTAPSMRRFKRYVQHFANPDLPREGRVLPAPAMAWESIAEHWIESLDMSSPGPEYAEQMQPHSFSDSAMEVTYARGDVIFQREDFRSGGVKVFHRLEAKAGIDLAQFRQHWRQRHVPLLLKTLQGRGLRKLSIDEPVAIDVEEFRRRRQATLLSQALITPPAGYEELWFDDLAAAQQLGRDRTVREALQASYGAFVDVERSYAMIAHERVVFDFVSEQERSPPPAVLRSDVLDAVVFKTGRPYHEPREEQS